MSRLEKIRRWEVIKELFASNFSSLVIEFHTLSRDLYGCPTNVGPYKNGWSIEDTARELRKSASFIRRCQEKEKRRNK